MNFDSWTINNEEVIDNLIDDIEIQETKNKTHQNMSILNTDKNSYSYLELFVKEISNFHINRIKTNESDKYYSEFWIKTYTGKGPDILHVDCDEVSRKKKYKNASSNYIVCYIS